MEISELTLIHDGEVDLALGKSRKEIKWKNRTWQWSELVVKLSETQRTHETHAEYIASKKPRQDEIKDVGGFVGGHLAGGRRKSGSVTHRQLVTLDADFAGDDMWKEFTEIFDCAAACYSTHKHSPDMPRLRFVIPLDRPVNCEEYVAISRWMAGQIGIEYFDPTGHQAERLMYWPSTSKDGEFEFHYQDAEWISADGILAQYHDWRDSSEWPMSERETTIVATSMKKQGDPLEKPGIVGAFCRKYSIHEAIDTYLSEVYEACLDDRYTFIGGSTSAGLVTYDEKFAYSHHGTDPASMKLCNSFDLVRIHLFGLQDGNVKEGTPINKLPSYLAMELEASKDPQVRQMLVEEKLERARADFEEIDEEEDEVEEDNLDLRGVSPQLAADADSAEENNDWMQKLDTDKKGNVHSTINNVAIILENDPRLKGRFKRDAFRNRRMIVGRLPWRKVDRFTNLFDDDDMANLRKYLEIYDINSAPKVKDALDAHYAAHTFHPVREYLEACSWDGKPRAERILIDYMGAEDNLYVRTVTRKALLAAVTRIFNPGAKFDEVLTLVGPQGIGKSEFIRRLAVDWFSDSFEFRMLASKEAVEALQGQWLIEIGELAGMKRADIEAIKHFIAKREDTFRPAYAQNQTTAYRQCVFWATTNKDAFLRDVTGDRRWWPVKVNGCKDMWGQFTPDVVKQVWAEVMTFHASKEKLHLDEDIRIEAVRRQRDHAETDPRQGIVENFLNSKIPSNWKDMDVFERRSFLSGSDELQPDGTIERTKVCTTEIWCEAFNGRPEQFDRIKANEINDIMARIEGWEKYNGALDFGRYGKLRAYIKSGRYVVKAKKANNLL